MARKAIKVIYETGHHTMSEIVDYFNAQYRHGSRATIITSQLPLDQWHAIIGDATLADATMD